MLDQRRILTLFAELDTELQAQGHRADLFVVGGAAMALVYDTRRATRDIDAIFAPKAELYEAAARVRERHNDLDKDWLNDAVKLHLLGNDPNATVAYDSPGLRVSVASAGYLFAMKAAAARVTRDADDLEFLYHRLGFGSADEAFDYLAATFPALRLVPRTQYLIEEIAAEATGDTQDTIAALDLGHLPARTNTCGRIVASTGKPCLLRPGHRGHCRSTTRRN